jgi:hypothetical protein
MKMPVEMNSLLWIHKASARAHDNLENLNLRSFIFNTYKIAQQTCACMRCIPCMPCLICVSLRDVLRDVCQRYHSS